MAVTVATRDSRAGSVVRGRAVTAIATAILAVWAASVPVAAQTSAGPVTPVETAAARQAFFAEMPVNPASEPPPAERTVRVPGSPPVVVRSDEQLGHRYYQFLPAGPDGPELVAPGSVVVKQRVSDGAYVQIKVFLQRNEGAYFRLQPRPGRPTLELELYLGGALFYQDVSVPLTMDRAVVAPVSEIQRVTAGLIDWSIAEPDASHPGYRRVEEMVSAIRPLLPTLPDAEDGAMDADGHLVFIETLAPMEDLPGFNCSGFAKWVVDGLYEPTAGSYLPIDALRVKHLNHRGTRWSRRLEDERDPYFGLDWTRNLAVQMAALDSGRDPSAVDPESLDVRSVPVARYREDVGYPVSDLRAVLYWLAVEAPGSIYLGSVSRPFGDDVVLRQHTHVVVFLPYFDRRGRFFPVVMERNVETSVDSLETRYGDDFVHLVRVETDHPFVPPVFVPPEEPVFLR